MLKNRENETKSSSEVLNKPLRDFDSKSSRFEGFTWQLALYSHDICSQFVFQFMCFSFSFFSYLFFFLDNYLHLLRFPLRRR